MAEEQVQDAAQSLAAEYDHGDQNTPVTVDIPTRTPEAERPRNSDGTFAKAAPPQPTIPGYLKRLALNAGFEESDIEGLSSEQIERAIDLAARNRPTPIQQHVEEARQRVEERPAPQDEPEATDDGFPTEDGWDPEAQKLVRIVKQLRGELAEMKDTIRELVGREQKRVADTHFSKVDRAFESLGAPDVLGRGTREDLDPAKDAAFIARRVAVLQLAGSIAGKNASQADIHRKIPEAYATLFGAKSVPQPESRSEPQTNSGHPSVDDLLAERRKQWNGAGSAAPTQRQSAPPPRGNKRAEQKLASMLHDYAADNHNSGRIDDGENP